ncbi:hypothetical protein [Streptomyces olivochromogenes]|uniref:hypothetical protein n=1 Tax=Streptomyces olivochromogenes TaxID=1963 RepID=UPI001F1C1164|nr:hypothetical protein [Streptomyces olivochromogenes]MCF3130541.1 hypothetical protein [Streptomyces olivochromogenes]
MTDQPYEGYQGYEGHQGYAAHDPYQQQAPNTAPQAAQGWPGQQGYEHQQGYGQQGYDQSGYDQSGYGSAAHGAAGTGYGTSGFDAAGYDQQQYTQQWQGQTWETQAHAPVSAAETAYMPPQNYDQPPAAPGHQQQAAAAAAHQGPVAPTHQQGHAAPVQQPEPTAEPGAGAEDANGGPTYGPATLAGNSRVTDAQRARMEGRSPIIEPGMQPAALTAVLGLLLAGTAAVGSYALVVPLVVLQAVTAAGWFRLNGMWPARQGIALAFAGGLTADAAVLVAGRDQAPAAILGPLGVWVLLSLILQLRSHASPDERMYGLMATVASSALAIIATGYLGADAHAASVGAAAVAVAVLARALPLPTPASVAVSLLAAAGAGIAVGGMTGLGAKGALLGAAAAVCALIGHRVASYDYPSRFVHFTAGVALPLSAAAPVVWLLGRALG